MHHRYRQCFESRSRNSIIGDRFKSSYYFLEKSINYIDTYMDLGKSRGVGQELRLDLQWIGQKT